MENISAVFTKTLSPNGAIRQEAEQLLSGFIFDESTMNLFFTYIISKDIEINLRKSASTFLKKYIKDFWFDDTPSAMAHPEKVIKPEVKEFFKANSIQLCLSAEQALLPIIQDMIVCIIQQANGYNVIWPDLMSKLREILEKKNYQISTEIYQLISKVIKRYSFESKSVPLFDEIKKTLKEICPIMTYDATYFSNFLMNINATTDQSQSKQCMIIMKRIMQIFYCLNAQDFPEFFEDHLSEWITIISNLISFPVAKDSNYDTATSLKAKTMKCLNMYFNYYYDDISDYANGFYPIVWKLNEITAQSNPYSKLTTTLLAFYESGINYKRIKKLDTKELDILINNLIIPNLKMTQSDIEEFEDNPISFLKGELEQTDLVTNKFYAINLLKNLIEIYPDITNSLITPMIQKLLENYYSNKASNWNDKILAINLIFAIAIKHQSQAYGITELNPNTKLDCNSLISEVFTKEFQTPQDSPIGKIYSLKFLIIFRRQIPVQFLSNVIDMLITIMSSNEKVVQTACLLALDKIILLQNSEYKYVAQEVINTQETFQKLTSCLVQFIQNELNAFAMKCFNFTLKLANEIFFKDCMDFFIKTAKGILANIMKDTSQDDFNYQFFDSLCIIINKLAKVDIKLVSTFESSIRNELNQILTNALTDVMNYTFQFFCLYVHLTHDTSEFYNNLLQKLLFDMNSWNLSMRHMFQPFLTYIQVQLINNKAFFSNAGIVDQFFKICGVLLNANSFDKMFFLLDNFVEFYNVNNQYGQLVSNLITTSVNLANSISTSNPRKSMKLSSEIIKFLANFAIKSGVENAMAIINQIGSFEYLEKSLDFFCEDKFRMYKQKVGLYFYCLVLTKYFSMMNQNTIKSIVQQILLAFQGVNQFKSTGGGPRERENVFEGQEYKTLVDGAVKIKVSTKEEIDKMDEHAMFFNALNAIKSSTGTNLVQVILPGLKTRQVDYIKTIAKKNNFQVD